MRRSQDHSRSPLTPRTATISTLYLSSQDDPLIHHNRLRAHNARMTNAIIVAKHGLEPAPPSRRDTPGLAAEFAELRRALGDLLNPYRPERYYMRGPGPKWHAKHAAPIEEADVAFCEVTP